MNDFIKDYKEGMRHLEDGEVNAAERFFRKAADTANSPDEVRKINEALKWFNV